MNPIPVHISGMGVLSALGITPTETLESLRTGNSFLAPLSRFPTPFAPLPVGEITGLSPEKDIPFTHHIALLAADQAMAGSPHAIDAVIIGSTTGGIAVTEALLKEGCTEPARYSRHAVFTVAEDIAARFGCTGPAITLSTACSSGAGAIALAVAMLQTGRFKRILAGGADSLSRLTYYGFKSLQLIDPDGARPLSPNRRGMSVAEGAGMLLLEAGPAKDGIGVLGAGLSCDAHHPTQPHPEGVGAAAAMRQALDAAGLAPDQIDYISLHGTGTPDNDRAEALAVKAVFGESPPPLSSIKGAMGHPLAAAGAIEAVVAALAIEEGFLPANTGSTETDLGLSPVPAPQQGKVDTVLSNSFGFGGNNATLVLGRSGEAPKGAPLPEPPPFTAHGWSAVTGAGLTADTLEKLTAGLSCEGKLPPQVLCEGLPPKTTRRLKRLSQMALALSTGAQQGDPPHSVFFGTAWGSLSETADFLGELFSSQEKFSSPTDFIGSVHNAPAGQIALMVHATGPNITVSGGDYSFEQALFSAQHLIRDDAPVLVAGADEAHETLSPRFDPSVPKNGVLSDGGGSLLLRRTKGSGPTVRLAHFTTAGLALEDLVASLGGAERIHQTCGLILAGIPAAFRKEGEAQLARFTALTRFNGKIMDYRRLTGEFAAASAVATTFAASLVQTRSPLLPSGKGVLVLGFGKSLTAIEVLPS